MLNANNWDYFKNKVSKLATFSGCIEIHKIVITYDQVKHGDIIEIASMDGNMRLKNFISRNYVASLETSAYERKIFFYFLLSPTTVPIIEPKSSFGQHWNYLTTQF